MFATGEIKTATVKVCVSCPGGILDSDKFCRWCGASQNAIAASGGISVERPAMVSGMPWSYMTRAIEPLDPPNNFHRVSGPLVSAVVATIATGPASQARESFSARAIAALLSFPLWLIIVLLSPLDAYAAAKNLSRSL